MIRRQLEPLALVGSLLKSIINSEKMKTPLKSRYNIWLIFGLSILVFGLVESCVQEDFLDRGIEVDLQITLPEADNLKSANSMAGVQRVTLTVSSPDKEVLTQDLKISGNTASGTISITPANDLNFTVEAFDANEIVQWHGSETTDVKNNFALNIGMEPIPPNVPELLIVVKELAVNLSWDQNTDPDFASYELYRSDSRENTGEKIHTISVVTETSYTDSLVTGGSTYYYTLTVLDTEGFSTVGQPKPGEVERVGPIASVIQADTIRRSVELSWSKNLDDDFAEYELYKTQNETELGQKIYTATTRNDTSYVDNQVLEREVYYYTIVVIDSEQLRDTSNVAQITIPNFPPSAGILESIIKDKTVNLSWTQNVESDFARYDLHKSETDIEIGEIVYSSTSPNDTVYTDDDVIENMDYYYTLIVYDSEEFKDSSNTVHANIGNDPPTPSNLVFISVDSSGVKLEWSKNPDNDFAHYELYRSTRKNALDENIFDSSNKNDTVYIDDYIFEGDTYYYTLVVSDDQDASSNSNEVEVQIPYPTPSELFGDWDETEGGYGIYLHWTENMESDFQRYELYRSEVHSSTEEMIHSTSSFDDVYFDDYDIKEGKTYYYTLITFDENGFNSESNGLEVDLPPTYSFLILDSLSFNYDKESYDVHIHWTPNPDHDFDKYELLKSVNSDNDYQLITTVMNVNDTIFIDSGLGYDTFYYKLIIYDLSGQTTECLLTVRDPYSGTFIKRE